MHITIVIPTYNEAENLPKLVSALFMLPLDLRILVVDDNSPDGTGAIADELARLDGRLRVLHRGGKEGLRSAYLTGFRLALDDGAFQERSRKARAYAASPRLHAQSVTANAELLARMLLSRGGGSPA